MTVDHVEAAGRRRDIADRSRAVYFWQVRRMPDVFVPGVQLDTEVLIQEYEPSGILHRLAEIKILPPYLWCAQSYRETEGIVSRFIPIMPNHEPIWLHRVIEHVSTFPVHDPNYTARYHEDCMIFGRRELFTKQDELMLIYPDGAAYEVPSMDAALRFNRD